MEAIVCFWQLSVGGGLLFSMKLDTCLHSEFKAVQLTTWYSCLFGWKVRPHQNLYLHKTFDLPQMNAQDRVSTTLLRLGEFIFHLSPNYLHWRQLCEIPAQKTGKRGKNWSPGTMQIKRKKRGRDALGLYIFVSCLPPAPFSNWFSHSGLEHAVFASTSCFFGVPGVPERNPSTPLTVVTGRKAAMTAGDLLWWRRPVELDKLPGVESVIQSLMQPKIERKRVRQIDERRELM